MFKRSVADYNLHKGMEVIQERAKAEGNNEGVCIFGSFLAVTI